MLTIHWSERPPCGWSPLSSNVIIRDLSMKIRKLSWVLGGGTFLVGLFLLIIPPKFQKIFSEMEVPLPVLTKILYFLSPSTWFVVFCILAVLFVFKDRAINMEWLNAILTIFLILFFGLVVIALFLPQIVDIQKISPK